MLSCECSFTHCRPKVKKKKQTFDTAEYGALYYFSTHIQWMGGDCIGSALVFSGIHSLKSVFKNLDQPYLTKTTVCQIHPVPSISMLFWVCFFFFKLIRFSMSYAKCWQTILEILSFGLFPLFSIAEDARKTKFLFPVAPNLTIF